MIRLTKFLVEETGAIVGYTQSDEISLTWHSTDHKSQIFFDGRVLKIASVLAAQASVKFNGLMFAKGVNFNGYPSFFKRGTYIRRKKSLMAFSQDEINKLPAKHAARTNPKLMVERSTVDVFDMPPITTVANREEVLFEGQEPSLI